MAGWEERFDDYVERLGDTLGHADRRGPLRAYTTGLLLPGERKSVEPMAARVDRAAVVDNKRLGAVLAHIRERQDAYEPAWNADRRPATRNNLRRAAEGAGLTSLTGADP